MYNNSKISNDQQLVQRNDIQKTDIAQHFVQPAPSQKITNHNHKEQNDTIHPRSNKPPHRTAQLIIFIIIKRLTQQHAFQQRGPPTSRAEPSLSPSRSPLHSLIDHRRIAPSKRKPLTGTGVNLRPNSSGLTIFNN